MPAKLEDIGTGATQELCLRVSAAALVRVLLPHPETGETMLALERKATQNQAQGPKTFAVTAQPFGGGIRINHPAELMAQIGNFHFDSPRSKDEQDFRILIRPADWKVVKQCCLSAFRAGWTEFLETDPARELVEEFFDTLHVTLASTQYWLRLLELLVENEPAQTDNLRALHLPTVRIYTIFEARLIDPALVQHLLNNSVNISDHNLMEMASEDAQRGGKGRANGVLALPVDPLTKIYQNLPPEKRNHPIIADGHHLEGNVPAVLEKVPVPKYERFTIY